MRSNISKPKYCILLRGNIWKVYIMFDAMFLREMVFAQSRLGLCCMHTYYMYIYIIYMYITKIGLHLLSYLSRISSVGRVLYHFGLIYLLTRICVH